jgi:hypothetical protein
MLHTDRAIRKSGTAICHRGAIDTYTRLLIAAPAAPCPGGSARPGAAGAPARRSEVDAVRGLVMIVMALDHVRDFLGNAHFDATDVAQTTAPIFLSRSITHVCAPTFFLLTG